MEGSSLFTLLISIGIIIAIWLLMMLLSRFKAFENRLYNIELFLFNNSRQETETSTTPCNEPDVRADENTADASVIPDIPEHSIREESMELYYPDEPEEEEYHTLPANIPPIPAAITEPSISPESKDIEPHTRRHNIERQIGVNLFSKIGILVLIIGVGFFVKYAIDNNWINEVARALLGMATGLGLWGIAYRLRDSYRNFSSVLAGGGFAVCFVTIAIAHNIYALITDSILETAAKNPGAVFIIDQAYSDYTLQPLGTPAEAAGIGNLMILSSLTKRFAVPGLRIGYAVGSEKLMSEIGKMRMPWSVNQLAIEAARFLINHSDDYVIDSRGLHAEALRIGKEMAGMGITSTETDCNFLLAKLPQGKKASQLKDFLIDRYGILIRDASNFEGIDGSYFRIAAQRHEENDLLLTALREWMSQS